MTKDYTNQFIDGTWVRGSGPGFASIDPFSGQEWVRLTSATREDVARAIGAAEKAAPEWARTPGVERGRLLDELAGALRDDLDALAEIETRDSGKVYRENKAQIAF